MQTAKKSTPPPDEKTAALAGNPNVGKSTVFNGLTGMNQHTGNWPGKTVATALGRFSSEKHRYLMVDLPGTYSLLAHSAEEEVARNYICFHAPEAVVCVCDATCLERNLILVLQILEITSKVIVCVNLMDEAKRKHISIDLAALSAALGVPAIGVVARKKKSLSALVGVLDEMIDSTAAILPPPVRYPEAIENAIAVLEPAVESKTGGKLNGRWLALKLLESDELLHTEIRKYLGAAFYNDNAINTALNEAHKRLEDGGITADMLTDQIASASVHTAEAICAKVVTCKNSFYAAADRKIDRILTGKLTAYPIMLALLAAVFWLTITGANYPSQIISTLLFRVQDELTGLFTLLGAPDWLHGVLVLGVYRVLAWVVSVMLPPMAIFFPLFTLLEDLGYLPRVAYNLDKPFKRCKACGKQALTMCMGFGCNTVGIVGCRIIDSPRERLLALLTNCFVPCNGRFPTLIAILAMFFAGAVTGAFSSVLSALLLTAVIAVGVGMTFAVTRILSGTLLKGETSSFTLELPPYRKPQVGKVIVRSVLDRTLFVLGRAVSVAAPAGAVIWLMANLTVGGESLLGISAGFLDPFARLMGLDGVILIAFILGFPANEIVLPIIIMAYMAQGSILELGSLEEMKQLFIANGWTWVTAACTMLFSLMHWPCSTTLLTIKKETGSLKWTFLAFAIPTVTGIVACILFAFVAGLILP